MGDYIFIGGIHNTYNMLYRFFGNVNNLCGGLFDFFFIFSQGVIILKEYLLAQVINIYINQKHSILSFFKAWGTINTEKVLQL